MNEEDYFEQYRRSIDDGERYWAEQAKRIDWLEPFTQIKDVSFQKEDVRIRWYYDGALNVCENCVDRHLRGWVRKEIGPIATPDLLQWASGLPKTRSGKIMRLILRKIGENDFETISDVSTLANPFVVQEWLTNV